ncbi:MAG: hypothetical protein CMN32_03420 [Saprospirales bacterium]|nr:hypothetical protein [Saprospirales bacterium]
MKKVNKVEEYIEKHAEWATELNLLRQLISETELEETIKWGAPTYTLKGKNVVGLGAFKSYVGIWFFQGALLSDPKGLLINAQEGTTKALRQMRFQKLEEIDADTVTAYLHEAILNQKQGKRIKPAKAGTKPLIIPDELQNALNENADLKAAFESLSLSHKREYADYVGEAKREETRLRRLEKIIPMIMERISMNDKYRKK